MGCCILSRCRFFDVVLVVFFFAVVVFVVRVLRPLFLLQLIACKRSTSPPGGNQVDGLPPALSLARGGFGTISVLLRRVQIVLVL